MWFFFIFIAVVLRVEPRTSHMLDYTLSLSYPLLLCVAYLEGQRVLSLLSAFINTNFKI